MFSVKVDGVNYNVLNVGTNTTLTGQENLVYLSAGILTLARVRDSVEQVVVKNISAGALEVKAYQGLTLTSGTLIIGDEYYMTNWITTDDFENVGGQNVDDTSFVATGTTPTTWANSSQVTELVSNKVNHNVSFMLAAGKTAYLQNDRNRWMIAKIEDNSVWDISAEIAEQSKTVWKGLLTQSSTSAPTAKVLANSLGGSIVWARGGTGVYTGTLVAAFTANKTFINKAHQSNIDDPTHTFKVVRTSADVITISTYSGSYATAADGVLVDTELMIEVYQS